MSKKIRAFTLIELSIVVACIMVFGGVGSKLWIQTLQTEKQSKRNMTYLAGSQIVLDRITREIRASLSASQPEGELLELVQLTPEGERRTVSYRMEDRELIRLERTGEGAEKSLKVASLQNIQISFAMTENQAIRIELRQEGRDQPLQVRTRTLVAFARPGRGVQ
ncbi:MAG TPA: hypothetical protein PLG59_08660 [bacterium]|nr:hypothetical protein [bacterium]HQO34717.1 hypothetical protein [bacterium]HQP99081.1 hypothetical protein [bacterium]